MRTARPATDVTLTRVTLPLPATVRAPLTLATLNSGAAEFGPIELEPPPVTPARIVGAAARAIALRLSDQSGERANQ